MKTKGFILAKLTGENGSVIWDFLQILSIYNIFSYFLSSGIFLNIKVNCLKVIKR